MSIDPRLQCTHGFIPSSETLSRPATPFTRWFSSGLPVAAAFASGNQFQGIQSIVQARTE